MFTVGRLPLFLFLGTRLSAQGTAETQTALDRLNVLGSVLIIGAHEDDDDTASVAYFALGRHCRTAYLSIAHGCGAQNLIGDEQGDLMGVLLQQEALAARRLYGAEQLFTRAIDFGFSKTAAEVLVKWPREKILSDLVWIIRRFQPDVVILCYTGTPRDGHGAHQASAILGREAYAAAGDPRQFPEQLSHWTLAVTTHSSENPTGSFPQSAAASSAARRWGSWRLPMNAGAFSHSSMANPPTRTHSRVSKQVGRELLAVRRSAEFSPRQRGISTRSTRIGLCRRFSRPDPFFAD